MPTRKQMSATSGNESTPARTAWVTVARSRTRSPRNGPRTARSKAVTANRHNEPVSATKSRVEPPMALSTPFIGRAV